MKKILSIALALIMILAALTMVACDKKGDKKGDNSAEKGSEGASAIKTASHDIEFGIATVPESFSFLGCSSMGAIFSNLSTGDVIEYSYYEGFVYDDEDFDDYMPDSAGELIEDWMSGNDDPYSELVVSDVKVVSFADNYYHTTAIVSKNGLTLYYTMYGYSRRVVNDDEEEMYQTVQIHVAEQKPERPNAAFVDFTFPIINSNTEETN